VRGPKGDLDSAPITFIAELALHRLEPPQQLRRHNLIDVVGARQEIPWRGSKEGSQAIRVFGGSPQ
jgi:hypothetical protein